MSDHLPEIEEALKAIQAVFKYEPSGGYLHSIISDGNLDCLPSVEDIDDLKKTGNPWTGESYTAATLRRYRRCIEALEKLTIEGREYAHAIYCGYVDDWLEERERMERLCEVSEFNERDMIF